MIKETDASKNDERRVQNKLNPLTHKRKGETRTMYNQSTKHWKLGAFFVISLMLVAGLFADTAPAQSAATIAVSPTTTVKKVVHGTFYADDIVDLTVTYTVTARAIDPGNDNADGEDDKLAADPANLPGDPEGVGADPVREDVNEIVFSLPAGIDAAYPTGTPSFTLDATEYEYEVDVDLNPSGPLQEDSNDVAIPIATDRGGTRKVKVIKPNATSYITWDESLSDGLKVVATPTIDENGATTVTVTIIREDESKAIMRKGNTVTVTYHNVRVPTGSFIVSATDVVSQLDPTTVSPPVANLVDRRDVDNPLSVSVNVKELEELAATAGRVEVTPPSFSAEDTMDLTVEYTASKALAVRHSKKDDYEDLDSTYGRIKIMLPVGWGPLVNGPDGVLDDPTNATQPIDDETIYEKRESGATWLDLKPSGGVIVRPGKDLDPDNEGKFLNTPASLTVVDATETNGWIILVDVDKMASRQNITLTIRDLKVPKLKENREGSRYNDIESEDGMEKVQVEVFSGHYVTPADRNNAMGVTEPDILPNEVDPEDDENEEQPTITLTRRKQGTLTLSDDKVNAGSTESFAITYKAGEDGLKKGDVIEIRLPKGWKEPMLYQLDDDKPTSAERDASDASYVYLKEASRLDGTVIHLIDNLGESAYFNDTDGIPTADRDDSVTVSDGWFVQIVLGKAVSRNSTIVLNYNDAIVQRHLTSDEELALIEAFSGPVVGADDNVILPQFPVEEQRKITVERAADGSGEVMFAFDGVPIKPLGDGKTVKANAAASIPAGIVADDAHSLVLTYKPVGDMGEGEFEFQMPAGWSAADILTSGDAKTTPASGEVKARTTVTSELPEHFGETEDVLEITLLDVTIPDKHGDQPFVAKSKREGSTTPKQLKSRPMAFIGNTMAVNDTVTVEITPAAAYVNQESVDFEITLTAKGPMHDSEIMITLPDGLADLEDDPAKSAEPNHVRKVSASVSGVEVIADPNESNEGIILIKTAKLNTGGKIKIHYDNVDLSDVDPAPSADPSKIVDEGFRVKTRTRGFDPEDDDGYVSIETDDVDRSISGGLIRTVAGSGTMVVEPATVEQGSRNKNFKLTFTATTDFSKLNLIITVPDVIETELQKDHSSDDGYVRYVTSKFHADIEADDRLEVSGNEITLTGVVLDKGEKFVLEVKRVDLLEDTGNFPWKTTLDGANLLTDDNPPMVVVGTTEDDIVFEVVDESDISDSNPSYHASSMQSIRFKFMAANTAIQEGGRLWFSVPVGWSLPSLTDKAGKATVSIVHLVDGEETFVTKIPEKNDGAKKAGEQMSLSVQSRSVILTIGAEGGIELDGSVTIQYGYISDPPGTGFPVQISSSAKGTSDRDDDGLSIRGHFRVNDLPGFRQRDAGTIFVDVTNVEDGKGTATLSSAPATVRAGSKRNTITVTFTGTGTMDGGAVRFTIPEGWGAMQDEDNLKRNYTEIDVSGSGAEKTDHEILDDGLQVVANLKTFGKGNKVTLTYGGGRGGRDDRGATAQEDIGEATFMVESMGGADGDFVDIRGDDAADAANPLAIEIKGAESGSGEGIVEIVKSKSGEGLYDGETDTDEQMMQVHAGDDSTYLKFTYTPSQTIAEGQLRFTVPGTWTEPQRDATDRPGYTYLHSDSGTVSSETYDETTQSVVADISLTLDDDIEIHYGWYETETGGAEAPDEVPTGGYSQFAISVKGNLDDDDDEGFVNIDGEDLMVRVRVQRSGGGMAAASPMTVNAGDVMSAITVTYTADGQVDDGMLKLTIPGTAEDWDAPTMDNVTIVGGGSSTAARFGGAHTAVELTALAAVATDDVDLGAMDVLVDNVMMAGGDTVTFMYTSEMAQGTTGSAAFAVAIDSGDGPDTGPKAVDGMTTVTVGEAAPGSGMAMATTDGIVLPGSPENTLTFTYTVAGESSYPADVRVAVTDDWTAVVSSNYTVTHKRAGRTHLDMVQKLSPIDGAMVARVISGEKVMAGDEIIFELSNVTAPVTVGSYPFAVTFRGQPIAANPMVIVQTAEASKLAIEAPATIAGDAGAVPVAITIMIQDAAGGAAASANATTVNLTSTNTTTGSFTSDGEAVEMVTIPAGMSSAMVYYSDTRVGSTAIIVASDNAAALDAATVSILVTTSMDAVSSVTVSPAMAKAGDVTVTVRGTPGKTGTAAVFSVGELVTNASLTESATSAGTYTGTVPVVPDLNDGTHDVTATLGEASKTVEGALTIDTMMPTITLTAPAADMTVANGGSVTITATAGDGTGSGIASVMADVSMLDSTQTDVALMMGADGSYSVDVAISDDNEAVNGSKTITVAAMDAAGNSAMAEVMVMLDNKMSFTSMIPAGQTVLFHVPLDDDDVSTVGDLKEMLGDAVNLAIIWSAAESRWDSNTDDLVITADLGLILSMNAEATVAFKGDAWGNGVSEIELKAGRNIIGLPLKDSGVTKVSDLLTALGVDSVTVSTNGGFVAVAKAGDPGGDDPVMGDAAYMVTSAADKTVPVLGSGWSNGDAASAAPIALAGYNVDNQTPVLDVRGSVVDEITGLAREGFRVKVKNLSTKAALSSVPSAEAADGYNMTFVDLTDAHAARVGDVLEISADSPDPLVGVKPVRHIVTIDDVKSNRIQLENLIAYEIPAETELLRNYPNPFNPETWIPYHLAEDADVSLTIYETTGRLVRTIDVGHQTAAKYDTRSKAIYWDGRNQFGEQVASGLYFYSLIAGDFSATRRMVILK